MTTTTSTQLMRQVARMNAAPPRKPIQKTVEEIASSAGALPGLQAALADGKTFYLKAEVPGYMPLVIEVLGASREVSIAHYTTQNGDAMRDPEYVFETRHWRPIEVTMDFVGFYHRVRPGCYLGGGASEFCNVWATNIRRQGFADPKRATYTVKFDS